LADVVTQSSNVDLLRSAIADRYRIERELGAGGMATVYLAHDLRHERDVAVKVLHPDLGAALGDERFLSEIRTTARLQHPHILPLLDSGSADGLLFYVMPRVRGETLRARLDRERQLPLADALRIAREVADALQHAHTHGTIHRDIKPENVLLQDGHALVADFGIALAVQTAGGARMTQTGLSLGTPQYMSPEQAMGERVIDARSDIYALGAMTYEMLTGDAPFSGSTVQAIVARVLTEKPTPLHTLRDTVPPAVEEAVLRALAKLPADRFATAAEFAAALSTDRGATSRADLATPDHRRALGRARHTSMVLAGVAAVAVSAAGWVWFRDVPAPEAPLSRLELTNSADLRVAYPTAGTVTALALSPRADRAVFAAEHAGGWALAVRDLDQLTARVLAGTEGAAYPEFSPDGKWIAFESPDGFLKRIAVNGTSLTNIARLPTPRTGGLTWLSDSEIAFSGNVLPNSALYRVSANGGTPTQLARVDSASGERFQLEPRAVDRGRLVLYSSARASAADMALGVVDVGAGTTKLFQSVRISRALGVVGDVIVYVRVDGALMAVPFDRRALTVGTPVQVGDSVAAHNWDAAAALSSNGTLLYQQGGTAGQLVRVDSRGEVTVVVDSVRPYVHPRFSPDGKRIAFEVNGAGRVDLWTFELDSKALARLTNGGTNERPEWSPDGTRIIYASDRDSAYALWSQPVDGSSSPTRLYIARDPVREGVFAHNGRSLVYRVDAMNTSRDIWMVPLDGEQKAVPLLTTTHDEKQPRVSPDSKWLAYVSNESGREEVYVRSLAAASGRVAVSAGGAGEPLWAPDGRRLYYRAGDRLMEATLSAGPSLGVTSRRVVFSGLYASDGYHPNYDIAPDGRSFLMIRPAAAARRMVMVMNWGSTLRRIGEPR
jgi:Tol biopolymer transport system component